MAAGSIPGLVLGVLIGHLFDRALVKALRFASPENLEQVRNGFFRKQRFSCWATGQGRRPYIEIGD
ncbi:MAG: hypothetical protein R3E50_09240 [Halioglobus sp.]